MKNLLIPVLFLIHVSAKSQSSPFFERLPVGKYAVGFKIVTITDKSRVSKPRINYFGETERGDLYKKISIHIWYPAKNNTGKGSLTYGDYCYAHLLSSTNEEIDENRKIAMQNNFRNYFEGYFGRIADSDWKNLKESVLLGQKDAEGVNEKFPLLIGMLRPLSTTVTNELMASNGYVVAMVLSSSGRLPLGYIQDVTDMQQAITYTIGTGQVDENIVGTYGFSGSGFSQVLLAMNDPRISALSDIESALYGEGLWELLSSSNYCDVSKLKIPFLHIYGKKLAEGDTYFEQFYKKKYSERYHLLLNDRNLHHWDVATEGRGSTTVIHVRGNKEPGIRASFELANIYLLNFFNAVLKKSTESKKFLEAKSSISYPDSLWSIKKYPAIAAPPDKAQFEEYIKRKGVDEGISLARHFHQVDSTSEFIHENALNQLARQYQAQNNFKEGLALMQIAVEFYPDKAWLWNNFADMQEANGNKDQAIRCSEKVAELLANDRGGEQSFNQRVLRSSQERLKRIKEKS